VADKKEITIFGSDSIVQEKDSFPTVCDNRQIAIAEQQDDL